MNGKIWVLVSRGVNSHHKPIVKSLKLWDIPSKKTDISAFKTEYFFKPSCCGLMQQAAQHHTSLCSLLPLPSGISWFASLFHPFHQLKQFCYCMGEGLGSGQKRFRESFELSQDTVLLHSYVGKSGRGSSEDVSIKGLTSWFPGLCSSHSVYLALKALVFEVNGILMPSYLSVTCRT